MDKNELEQMLCEKISLEKSFYKDQLLRQDNNQIYAEYYKTDCIINLYEQLLEMSQELEEGELRNLIIFPRLLTFLYEKWLQQEDSAWQELQQSIQNSIQEIQAAQKERDGAA